MIAECIVCAYEMDGKERVPSLGACGHNSMCSLCTLRIRALHRNVNCVTCKRELEHVICSDKPEAKFEDFPMWGDSIGPEFVLDQKSQMFFPSQYYKDVIQKLWVHKCKICSHTFRDIKSLRAHVSGEHNMHICLHCVENKHDFPAEQRVYTQKQYETHLREGDQDGSLGHPNCEFCRKRYYDAQALFVHLNKDHYNCHLCEKAGVKFKYFKDYKHMEEHFQKHHILCDDPACLAKKFIVFDNEIDFEVHNRKYHPTFAIKRASTIKLDFKVARNSNTTSNNSNNNRNEEVTKESGDEDQIHSSGQSGRYEGGFGGRARDGEWQVELQPISSDPRDINRNAHIVVGSAIASNSNSNSGGDNAPVEEFPTLPTSASTGAITLTNKWVSMGTNQGGARRPKKNDFPALQSNPKKTTLSAKLGGGSASSGGSSGISSIQREYDSMGNATSGTVGTSQRAVTGSLGDWARIKVEKKSGAKANITTTNTNASTSNSNTKQYTGYYSAQPPAVGYEESLARALAESLTDAYKSGGSTNDTTNNNASGDGAYTTVPSTKPYTLPTPPPPSSDAYPTLSSTTTTSTNTATNANTKNTKKKAPAAGGWNDALLSMGMNTTSGKKVVIKNKLSVIKAVTSEGSLNKLDTTSTTNTNTAGSGKWDNMKPVTKASEDEYRIGSGKSSPVPPTPPTTNTTNNSTSANSKKYGSWVKMGGATNGSIASQVDSSGGAGSADFPTLGSAKRTK